MSVLKYLTVDGWKILYGGVLNQILLKNNNLSDIENREIARENLELTGNNNMTHFHDSRYMPRSETQQNIDALNTSTTQRLNQIASDTTAQITAATAANTAQINALSTTVSSQIDTLSTNTSNQINTLRDDVANTYAKKDASNITVNSWASELGTGTVASNNANLVTGGTVYTAIQSEATARQNGINTLQGNITSLQSDVSSLQNGLSTLSTNVTTAINDSITEAFAEKAIVSNSYMSPIISGRDTVNAYSSGTMYFWYRIYNDGWTEQGGHFERASNNSTSLQVITLPVTMKDTQYLLLLSKEFTTRTGDASEVVFATQKTETNFKYIASWDNGTLYRPVNWYVAGYRDTSIEPNHDNG